MRTNASRIFGALAVVLAVCGANLAHAVQYPPGGPGCTPALVCADTLIKVSFIQNPAAAPHPVAPDTVWGIGGIITGFDTFPTGFAFYIQNRGTGGALPWSGVDVFTGGTNYVGLFTPPLALGDSVMCYGRLDEFQGGGELRGLDAVSAFNNPLVAVRRISQGNSLPPFRRTTVHELYELPTNLAAEQWEGCLVRVKDKMRIVRTSVDPGGIGTFSSMLAVDNTLCPNGSLGPCDSLFIDGSTLSFNPVTPLPHGAFIDSVQGIYDQRTRGYRIQLRDSNDLFDSSPPSFTDAYFITPDTIRCIFDRNLTQASANNTGNYTLSSILAPPNAAIRQVSNNVVHIAVTPGTIGDPQGVTVNSVVNAANGQMMTSAQAQTMFEGIVPITQVQAPDPAALAGSPCDDRSKFAGAGSVSGDRITMRGVCITNYGSTYFLETAAGGVRSGITLFAPIAALTAGHQYVLAGAIQEFFTETEFVGNVYVKDEGVVAVPAAAVQTVHVLRDTTCDVAQALSTVEDYEGMLVKVVDVKTTEERTAGQSFGVAGPYPTNPDTILVDNNIGARTFDPTKGQYVTVTGVMDLASSVFAGVQWRIQPRGDADIVVNPTLGVDNGLPAGVSFAITPSVSRTAKVTFALPKRDHVMIAVYDIVGRRLAVLANGEFPAGVKSLDWDARDASGRSVNSGMYFYKMTVAGQTFERRSIILN